MVAMWQGGLRAFGLLDEIAQLLAQPLQHTRFGHAAGDVRGVLEIIHPLDRDVERTRAGMRGTFVLMAVISGSLVALSVFVLIVAKRRGPSW